MYVARWGEGYILRRMPLTGDQHAPSCSSNEPVMYPVRRVVEAPPKSKQTGTEILWPAFAMSRRDPLDGAATPAAARNSSTDRRPRLSLRELLDYLWDRSELTRWHPGFEGRRNWAVVRKRLLCAAEGRLLGGQALPECLFMPGAFCKAWPDANALRLSAHWQRTTQRRSGRPLTLLIGEPKMILPESSGEAKVSIWHLARCPFTLSEALYVDVCRRFGRELSEWSTSKGARIVLLATFLVDDSGVPRIEEISLMPTSWEWIPLDDPFDRRLAEDLVEKRRHFRKLTRGAQPDPCPPTFELLDTANPPTPLFIEKWRGGVHDLMQTADSWIWRFGDPRLPSFQGYTAQAVEPHVGPDTWLADASPTASAEAGPNDPEVDDTLSGMPRLSHTTAA
jgi:hypothetical protein